MTTASSRLRVSERNGVTCIGFIDRNILDEANIQRIGDEISRVVESKVQPRILINFENVDHLSSAALGTLITVNDRVRSRDGQLRLACIDPQIHKVFVITRLVNLFQIYDTVDEALESFS